MVLEARKLIMEFGGVAALNDVSLTLGRGERVGLIGPNGSGKTTLLNVLSGVYRPSRGEVMMRSRDVTRLAPARRAGLGIRRTFQHPQLVASLSAFENVALGTLHARVPRVRMRAMVERAMDTFGLLPFRNLLPAELPYGAQKTLEVARAMVAGPDVLLLDEPAAGLSTAERRQLTAALLDYQDHAPETALCMIEHDITFVSRLCPRLVVLDRGRLLTQGAAADVLVDPSVKTAYLGDAPLEGDRL